MLTLITGAPGTGKTAAVVDLLHTLGKDRPLFVYGLDGLLIPHVPLVDPHKWMDEVPDGACIIIDECQDVWRPRGPGSKVPDHVAALETHRHRGLDFFLTTQGPNLVDANVRALVGRHIHLRELGILGRQWYEWPECADQCRTQFRNAPFKKRYRLPKHVFKDYKSASIHVKPLRSFPTALVVAALALSGVGYFAWGFYGKFRDKLAGGGPSIHATSTVRPAEQKMSRLQVEADPVSAQVPAPVAAVDLMAIPGPVPGPVFAGCAVVRGVCGCYNTDGSAVDDPPASACGSTLGGAVEPLGLADDDGGPRPSHDLQADLLLISSATRRAPLPLVR